MLDLRHLSRRVVVGLVGQLVVLVVLRQRKPLGPEELVEVAPELSGHGAVQNKIDRRVDQR